MPNIPTELIILVCASLFAWFLALAVKAAAEAYNAWRAANPRNSYLLDQAFEKGRYYGEQLIAKHGVTDREEVERRVLKFVNEYMISSGFEPPAREFAEAMIKATVREYNERMGK